MTKIKIQNKAIIHDGGVYSLCHGERPCYVYAEIVGYGMKYAQANIHIKYHVCVFELVV